MKEIFKYKNYMKMFSANLISRFGDSIDVIAFSFLVYKLTGSEILLATVFLLNILPNIILSSFSGSIVEFLPKKIVIIIGDFARAGLVFLTAVLYSKGTLVTWHLLVFTFLMSTIETFVAPSKSSVLPRMIDKEHYLTVNTSMRSLISFVELVGMAIAGGIIGYFGIFIAMIIDMTTFILSGIIVTTAKFPIDEKKKFTINNYWETYAEGMKFLLDKKIILTMILAMAAINFFLSPIDALLPSYVENIMRMGVEGISYFGVFISLGGIIGGFIGKKVGEKIGLKWMMFLGLVMMGLGVATLSLPGFISNFKPVYIVCTVAAILGVSLRFAQAAIGTIGMSMIPDNMRARVNSVMNMLVTSAMPAGAFVSGVLAAIIGLKYIILTFGVLIVTMSIIPTKIYGKYEREEKNKVPNKESTECESGINIA